MDEFFKEKEGVMFNPQPEENEALAQRSLRSIIVVECKGGNIYQIESCHPNSPEEPTLHIS